MTTRSEMSRRFVLQLLGWWIGLGASPLRSLAALGATSSDRTVPSDAALRLLRHRASAAAIGHQFLREHPNEADRDRLRGLLALPSFAGDLPWTEIARHRARLRAIHREDFRSGRVVDLGGWMLSLTELRLAALVALADEADRSGR
jgi:hypothetical protein